MSRYAKSAGLLEKARRFTPGGSQTRSKRAEAFAEGAFPAFLESGLGAMVWDVDGNGYVDWICGLGAITLGHGFPAVDEAVRDQLARGTVFSLPHSLEAEVAEMLVALVPCAEQVRFVKTGSEATEAAIRVARAATGKDVVVTVGSGYHSWHSWFSAVKPVHPGIPKEYGDLVVGFRYNDVASLQEALRLNAGRGVACVILEPCLLEEPAPGFLREVASVCRTFGALLIFDEIVTGFRWAIAGGQEFFGVTPDLACFGKGMANGFPLACLAGPADLMRHAEWASGTFGGECLSLAAAKATMETYVSENVVEALWRNGTAFRDGLAMQVELLSLPAKIVGYGVHPAIRWEHPEANLLMSLFLQEAAENGVLLHPAGWNVSCSHGEKEVGESLDGCRRALVEVRAALDFGEPEAFLRGVPIRQAGGPRGGTEGS